jgi:hypothetical protein
MHRLLVRAVPRHMDPWRRLSRQSADAIMPEVNKPKPAHLSPFSRIGIYKHADKTAHTYTHTQQKYARKHKGTCTHTRLQTNTSHTHHTHTHTYTSHTHTYTSHTHTHTHTHTHLPSCPRPNRWSRGSAPKSTIRGRRWWH